MKILSDNHIHTFYSGENGHAIGTIEEVVKAAIEKGMKEIIISDHGPGHKFYGYKICRMNEVRKEIDRLNGKYPQINILYGTEANVMGYNGEIDLTDKEKEFLDRISVGFHYGIFNMDIKSFIIFQICNPLSKFIKPLRKYLIRKNTDALINIIKKHNIDIITHPGCKVKLDIYRLAKECEKYGTALEINSSYHDALSYEDLEIALKTNCKFSIGSDSHKPQNIGNFERSLKKIEKYNIDKNRIINLVEE